MQITSTSTRRKRIALRYARALFESARESLKLEPIRKSINAVQACLAESADLRDFIADPEIPAERQTAILDRIFKKMTEARTLQFLHFLRSKERLELLPDICDRFESLYLDHHRIQNAHLTSAAALNESQLKAVSKKLKSVCDQDIRLTDTVDPSLIAGFTVRIGDQVTDLSVRNRLQKFRDDIINQ